MNNDNKLNVASILEFEALPASTYEFIRMLDKNIEHRCIGFNESEHQARYRAAQRDMIDQWVAQMEMELEGDQDEETAHKVLPTIKRPPSPKR